MLTERRAADRATMAAATVALATEFGATVVRRDGKEGGYPEARCIIVDIELGECRVGIEFDGGSFNTMPNVFCMPWNTLSRSKARMTSAFGSAVKADVNPHHRAKCMGFAHGFDELLVRLRAALECIRDGAAYEMPTEVER